jgi:hypothetical protein
LKAGAPLARPRTFTERAESLQFGLPGRSVLIANLQGAALTTRYDDPTATQLLSWGAIAVFLLVLLAYLFLSLVQYALG